MGKRGDRFKLRKIEQKESKAINGPHKAAERQRRTARMLAAIKTGKPPYAKVVRTWLSAQLGKPEAKITPDDVKQLLAKSK